MLPVPLRRAVAFLLATAPLAAPALAAEELGFSHVELVGKRPHVSPLDYERPGVPPDVQWGVVVQGLKMAAREAAKELAPYMVYTTVALEGGGSIENLDRTARRFLETFREMTK